MSNDEKNKEVIKLLLGQITKTSTGLVDLSSKIRDMITEMKDTMDAVNKTIEQ